MSDYNPHHGHDQHDPDHGQVESSSLSPKPVLLLLAVLFIATAFVFFVVKGMEWGFRKLDQSKPEQTATEVKSQDRKLPPSPMPLLQGAPGRDSTVTSDKPTDLPLEAMENLRKETDKKLNSYGWQEGAPGIAHIPIDRAKEMIAEKGLPMLSSPTISEEMQKAERVRREVGVAGSNAGRVISPQQPVPPPTQQPAQQPAPQSAQPQSAKPQQVQPQQH
jgi:hypothetical protein